MSALLLAATAWAAPYVVVLGVAQDAGHPQAGCTKRCCAAAYGSGGHRVASLGIVDPEAGRWLVDATPDLPAQLHDLGGLDGVFLTHAHMGHYLGLAHLGREAMGSRGVPVWTMPRMATFLTENGPWDQLVSLGNIVLQRLTADVPVTVGALTVTPFSVPHRDEYSETVGYVVRGPTGAVLWLPDIDKWERWDRRIEDLIATVDVAYLDGTFFADGEVPGRSMAEIPHPFVTESLDRLGRMPAELRARVRFVHLNHTNPALDPKSEAAAAIRDAGFAVAAEGERVAL